MKTLSKKQFNSLPSGFRESISERSQIYCAIANAKTFIKYAKECNKTAKDINHKDTNWVEIGQNSLKPYYKKLLEVEQLAKKYHLLWIDKYDATKKVCEKLLK